MHISRVIVAILLSTAPSVGCSAAAPPGPAVITSVPSGAPTSPTAYPPLPPSTATDPASGHVCTESSGSTTVALTFDGRGTLVQSRTPRRAYAQVYGLVALGTPYALPAIAGPLAFEGVRELFISVDGGCHWTSRGPINATSLTSGRDGVAYAAGERVYVITTAGSRPSGRPPGLMSHLVADISERNHLRFIGPDGVLDSTDTGETWRKIGDVGPILEHAPFAFAGNDLDHILYSRDRFCSRRCNSIHPPSR